MKAYEFVKMDSDFISKTRAVTPKDHVLAWKYIEDHRGDLLANQEYQDARNIFMDVTMSCDNDERIGWMNSFMDNAIAYGIYSRNTDWIYLYSAAYEIKKAIIAYRSSRNS